ncbi:MULTISPECIES: tetratricopeptide repeat protein [unclassified Microcystis]|jgi:tetratricopeptide (TPR) repeat protein|uniref:Tetratricopeptide repeat protein n=2 Tax=Microcystis aeruginosa TaxID=1126 RepID=A0A552FJP4_MICAE|nr:MULTISPECIES: tetratricopeptide repeat protein [unclassified Microcystis]MCA2925705.1 tetratricopeptide repeat protein [Microcystis sp. M020S1]MCA2934641.1 tetratricopeptide repeat protein [Microcystis sp. M015S1]MCU7245007.1 tetratricopeptide repeat protein [Microcystis aeruginosa WS75]NCR14977.1 tetratricopeptide repeat protein [Microcystis aeruginosa SX13-11]NCR19568.1 tetratricopeptide repeat protein [Microcystis aeruginosa LL13-03]NCR37702.1 tetratricopeptide repeat protein [Microcyst
MLDPQEFRNIIHQDFTEVTSQEFLANQKKYCPEIFEGDNYPNITENLNNLAKLYQSQGRYAEAEPLYLQALELRKRLLGENHPDVSSSLNGLAKLYNSQGKYEEAEPLYLQALAIAEQALGENHPNTVKIRESLQKMRQQQHPSY